MLGTPDESETVTEGWLGFFLAADSLCFFLPISVPIQTCSLPRSTQGRSKQLIGDLLCRYESGYDVLQRLTSPERSPVRAASRERSCIC